MKGKQNGRINLRHLTALLLVMVLIMASQCLMVNADASSISVAFEGSDFRNLVGRDDDSIIRLTGSEYCKYRSGTDNRTWTSYEGIQLVPYYADMEEMQEKGMDDRDAYVESVRANGAAGGAFITKAVKSDSDFALAFSVFLGNSYWESAPADGFCFVIAKDATSIGAQGGGIGYGGIPNSIGVEFDVFDNMGDGIDGCMSPHCDYHINGDVSHPNAEVDFSELWSIWGPDELLGSRVYCWMEYDAENCILYARFNRKNERPTAPTMTIADIDVKDIVGETCHLGFTASTGWADMQVVLESLYYDSKSSTPISIGEKYVAEIAHEHSFTYSASGNVITATCGTAGCYLIENKTTLTLTYDSESKTVGYVEGEAANWKAETGTAAPEIVYYLKDGTTLTTAENSGAAGSGQAPVNDGSYVAIATASGDKTAKLSFTVSASKGGGNDDGGSTDVPPVTEAAPYVAEEPSAINYVDGYFHFDKEADHVIAYAKTMSGEKFDVFGDENTGIYIDLTDETFTSSFAFNYYSLDKGKKWYEATEITQETLKKWFSKNIDLRLADKLDDRNKKPVEDSVVYGFETIKKRPSAPSLKIDFNVARDDYGLTNGQWVLISQKNKDLSDLYKYEIHITDAVGAEISMNMTGVPEGTMGSVFESYEAFTAAFGEDAWGRWPSAGGVWVPNVGDNGKTRKAKIELRVAASHDDNGYTAASKSKKLTVSSITKAPAIKANYQKEEIKFKKGMSVYFGTADSITTDENGVPSFYTFPADKEEKLFEDYAGTAIINTTNLGVKKALSISPYLTENRNTILLWQTATQKKPASARQTIKLEARYTLTKETLPEVIVSSGKAKVPEKFEILSKGKWTRSIPAVTTSTVIDIRYKADAKGGKESAADAESTTFATSDTAYLVLFYGEYTSGTKTRPGVEAAQIFLTKEEAEAAIAEWDAAKAAEEAAKAGTDVDSDLIDITAPATPEGDGLDILPQTGVAGMLAYMCFGSLLMCAGYALIKKH